MIIKLLLITTALLFAAPMTINAADRTNPVQENDEFITLEFTRADGVFETRVRRDETFIDLSNNQITAIPAEIGNLINLKTLYLNNNELASLPAEIGNLGNLKDLYLKQNQITSIPLELLKLPQIKNIDFMDNPFYGNEIITNDENVCIPGICNIQSLSPEECNITSLSHAIIAKGGENILITLINCGLNQKIKVFFLNYMGTSDTITIHPSQKGEPRVVETSIYADEYVEDLAKKLRAAENQITFEAFMGAIDNGERPTGMIYGTLAGKNDQRRA